MCGILLTGMVKEEKEIKKINKNAGKSFNDNGLLCY